MPAPGGESGKSKPILGESSMRNPARCAEVHLVQGAAMEAMTVVA